MNKANRAHRLAIPFKDLDAFVMVRQGLGEHSRGVPNALPELVCVGLQLHLYIKLSSGSHYQLGPQSLSHSSANFSCLPCLGLCIANVTGNAAIEITPASFTSAILNLVPGFTFILAVIFRMEEVHYRSSSTQAKSIGTLVLIVGALVVTLYKGPSLLTNPSHRNISQRFLIQQETNLITGGVLLVIDCLASSAFIIAQGFIGSAAQVSIVIWCLKKRGPLFVAVFHPLGIIISAAVGILFLGDIMYLGSLVGSIIIVAGFYSVMWGKANERKVFEDEVSSLDESTSEEATLLQNIQKTQF
ncbi:hypothetical protein RHGRI_034459 [Rhododendron griersonianum]|uniref:WAT1-related protein n=1 Tax=Rhododendron griersonianum TaxID=479676 RepID=A0AAV6I0S8_9ERIC|nr:hypothetical protein RHGRI_034459 [Rhododendron griersonianum]KAG5522279.1 hypothetical protein RHGRI_034459 [Rhododendron griersonianum]